METGAGAAVVVAAGAAVVVAAGAAVVAAGAAVVALAVVVVATGVAGVQPVAHEAVMTIIRARSKTTVLFMI
jgi:hypothetical protein